jgi:lipoprotein-anchoring transpeptidase ErfK/SrfK
MHHLPRAAMAALVLFASHAAEAQAPAAALARPAAAAVRSNGETWAQITPERVNARPARFPIGRGHQGPAVLRVQVLLNRALFSPGMIDGRWGKNTEVALHWLQVREGLPATGAVDSATMARLEALAGRADTLVERRPLRPDEVRGPFTKIPIDIYEHARLPCSCFESLTERLSETFHVTPEVLRRLNPRVPLDSLRAGDTLNVPVVRPTDAPAVGTIAELQVSGSGKFVHALDGTGRILYHFPTTLGSTFDPSPQGDFRVVSVHENPWWRYQPRLLASVPDDRPEANIPPGPNNAVGRVWVALSVPHYGIHGTKSPETIGYAQSAGCVRLTNWDVLFLSRRLPPGTPVRFRDIPGRKEAQDATGNGNPARPDSARAAADSTRRAPADTTRRAPADSARRTPSDSARRAVPDSARRPVPDSARAAPR